jgi:hypothetical protein
LKAAGSAPDIPLQTALLLPQTIPKITRNFRCGFNEIRSQSVLNIPQAFLCICEDLATFPSGGKPNCDFTALSDLNQGGLAFGCLGFARPA